ncbi:autorepressor SdpR family transcription factor [Spirosoma endbachense]|uniref:Autorepressor SdpR family transcription factor n=1 Tax=Spirosoma endbachense TaxID=2666025 RepID=A0A6P1VZ63_9BACT|nr:autorepressor SdpR family transcription factor [Spirosoma endbachense]QHV97914.1 autorepressor SdpR family transcription factor [Spirosoma endbachense]
MNNLFKALNDPTRRQILDLLREGDLNAGEIAERFDMTKPSISHHLDLLRQAGLVESVKQGQFITYSLNTTVLDDLLAWLMSFQKNETPATATNATEQAPEQIR